jgi:hypothetical protein
MNNFFCVLYIFFLFNVLSSQAQEIPVYNHFYTTPYLLNPAEAGAYPFMNASINHRQQWRGVEGAPVVTTITVESRLFQIKRQFTLWLVCRFNS